MGFIIWIIIIVWVVLSISKSKAGGTGGKNSGSQTITNHQRSQTVNRQRSQTANRQMDSWVDSNRKQQELKERLSKKYGSKAGQSKGDILQRAKASVEEDFSDDGYDKPKADSNRTNKGSFEARPMGISPQRNMKIEEAIYKKTIDDQTRKQEMERRVAEKLEAAEWKEGQKDSENVLRTVENLMIMGPNTELTFSRDFLAEGMDMLNRIQA